MKRHKSSSFNLRFNSSIIAQTQLNYRLTALNLEYVNRWLPSFLSTHDESPLRPSTRGFRLEHLTQAERTLAAQTPLALFDAAFDQWPQPRPVYHFAGEEPASFGFVLNIGSMIWHAARTDPQWTGMSFGLSMPALVQWRCLPYDGLPMLARLYCTKLKARWWRGGEYWATLMASAASAQPDRIKAFWRFSLQRQAAEIFEESKL
jgi:hypothetical protein